MFYRKNLGTTERWLRFLAVEATSCCGFFVFGTAPLAWIIAASGLLTILACGAGALVSMRGCPLCWTVPVMTVRASVLRSRLRSRPRLGADRSR